MMNAIAAIHVAKKQLGLDDETYRAMLTRVTGKSSTRDMSAREHEAVLGELRGKGFKRGSTLDGPFARKLQSLWIAAWNLGLVRDRRDSAMLAFVERQSGIAHTRFLRDAADGRRAIEALKSWTARAGVDWSNPAVQARWLRRPGAKVALAQWSFLARAGAVEPDGFRAFVQEHAFYRLEDMTPVAWAEIMNRLGRDVRKLKS